MRANRKVPPIIMTYMITCASRWLAMMALTICGFATCSIGPGCRLWMISALSRIESASPAGTPNDSNGIRVPPVVALLALSAATIASSLPCPKRSGWREAFFAVM